MPASVEAAHLISDDFDEIEFETFSLEFESMLKKINFLRVLCCTNRIMSLKDQTKD